MDKILNSTSLVNNSWDFNASSGGVMLNKTANPNPTEINDGEWYLTDRGRIEYKPNTSSTYNNAT